MHLCNDWMASVESDSVEDSLVHHMAADATAEISAETATLLQDVNEDDLDTDPFTSDEEFKDDKTVVDDKEHHS